jgi:hypothetical protein
MSGVDMTSDNIRGRTYAQAMERGLPFIRLKLNTHDPIEMGEFVSAFTSIAAEYDRFAKLNLNQPDDAAVYVQDVRDGCIEAQIIVWAAGVVAFAAAANTLAEFVERYGGRLSHYLKPGGRIEDATKSELKHFSEQVAAIASAPNGTLEVAAIEIDNGQEKVRAAFKFNTSEAREIERQVDDHRRELDRSGGTSYERALMVFTRSDVRTTALGKRSGELVRIASISERSLPLIYASNLAEQEIKHEIAEAEDNVYKKGFVVDVNVEENATGRPLAYRVTNLHQVIDLPDDS